MRNTAGSDESLTKLYQTFKRLEPLVAEQEIEGLYNAIDDKKWLEGVLSKFSDEALSAHKIDRPNTASFRYAASASLYAVTRHIPCKNKTGRTQHRQDIHRKRQGPFREHRRPVLGYVVLQRHK